MNYKTEADDFMAGLMERATERGVTSPRGLNRAAPCQPLGPGVDGRLHPVHSAEEAQPKRGSGVRWDGF
ncbi:MAG: hypothetical protein AB1393_08870 [Candidatus Edwardsbacteria bacterium]